MFHIHSFSDSSVTGATVACGEAYGTPGKYFWHPEVHTHRVCSCGASVVKVTKLPFVSTESLAWKAVIAYLHIVASQTSKTTLIVSMAELNVVFDGYAEKAAVKEAKANVSEDN